MQSRRAWRAGSRPERPACAGSWAAGTCLCFFPSLVHSFFPSFVRGALPLASLEGRSGGAHRGVRRRPWVAAWWSGRSRDRLFPTPGCGPCGRQGAAAPPSSPGPCALLRAAACGRALAPARSSPSWRRGGSAGAGPSPHRKADSPWTPSILVHHSSPPPQAARLVPAVRANHRLRSCGATRSASIVTGPWFSMRRGAILGKFTVPPLPRGLMAGSSPSSKSCV